MTQPVVRANPAGVSSTLKEAVVDSLLNLTYAQVSGQGPTGEFLFGSKPRAQLNSGFLLPQADPAGDDEVTSPIWISSHGFQAQLNANVSAKILVTPKLNVYVRVLPKEEDLRRQNCRPGFVMKADVVKEIQAERKARLDSAWKEFEAKGGSDRRSSEWLEISKKVIEDIYKAMGIPTQVLTSDLPAHLLSSEEESAETDTVQADGVERVAAVLPPEALASESAGATSGSAVTLNIRDDHFEPLKVPHKWYRLDVELPVLELDPSMPKEELDLLLLDHKQQMNDAVAKAVKSWAESTDPDKGGVAWAYRRNLVVPPSKAQRWNTFLDMVRKSNLALALPVIELSWDVQIHKDWVDPTKRTFFISLENTSERLKGQQAEETEESIFLVSLVAVMPRALHHPLRLDNVDPSYRFNQYLDYPGMGHNGGVVEIQAADGLCVLQTTWTPRYAQPRIVPTSTEGIVRKVRSLAQADGINGLKPLVPEMKSWLAGLPGRINPLKGVPVGDTLGQQREQRQFADDQRRWKAEIESIEAGLNCLLESQAAWSARGPQTNLKAAVYEAWLAMNEAMADFMRDRFGGNDHSEWRMFQLAFIIANIPALASRIPEMSHWYDEKRDDSVTLLYFATGGGKSEAFFGLLVFNLLLDRLRGKHKGVTALIRYPLRLLTIQQAQRCSWVMAKAEMVCRRNGYQGEILSIGFWVGSGGSPNHHNTPGIQDIPKVTDKPPLLKNELELRENDTKYFAAMRAWRKLPRCPFCREETALRRFESNGEKTLGHVCTSLSCASNGGTWQPLPFYIVDEDIYDIAPSVLLGTVDKLALIGHSGRTIRRIYGMFGAAPWVNPKSRRLYVPEKGTDFEAGPSSRGMKGIFPAYSGGEKVFLDPFPSLIIQDEAHLLDESLGSFAGLFESTLDAVFHSLARPLSSVVAKDENGKRRRPKVIAASATVANPQRQLEHLYQRSIPAAQFPEPGPELYESFYAKPAAAPEVQRASLPKVELASQHARVYTAFMTNGKPHTSTSVAVLSGFHLVVTKLFDNLTAADASSLQVVKDHLCAHISDGPLRSYHDAAVQNASASDLLTLIDLHRIALTYVTNKKGGDQIMAAEAEETRKRHLNEGVPLDGIDTRLITGSVEQGVIQEVVDTAQRRVAPGQQLPPIREQLRSVIATSAISHGVDVDEFNSMFFAGMPADIAEYIQASSRVGRTHIGFVVLLPTPQRRRDRYIVHVFDIFHRFLERMVQPAAIDRWAEKAVERVFPSLFQAYLMGVVPASAVIELAEDEKQNFPNNDYIQNVRKQYSRRGDAFIAEIVDFIQLAIGLKDVFIPTGGDHYKNLIEKKVRSLIIDAWSSESHSTSSIQGFFQSTTDISLKPMTSLRDVDQAGTIQAAFKFRGDKQSSEDVKVTMDLIRNGVGGDEDY